ncbi:MAG: hypothetical protein WBF58_05785 [Xanthobacteraceae bacterium]
MSSETYTTMLIRLPALLAELDGEAVFDASASLPVIDGVRWPLCRC